MLGVAHVSDNGILSKQHHLRELCFKLLLSPLAFRNIEGRLYVLSQMLHNES